MPRETLTNFESSNLVFAVRQSTRNNTSVLKFTAQLMLGIADYECHNQVHVKQLKGGDSMSSEIKVTVKLPFTRTMLEQPSRQAC